MQNQGEERWLTYAEAADLLGITTEALRLRARRAKWPRRTPNEHGAVARVLMPDDDRGTDRVIDRPQPPWSGGRPADDRRTATSQPAGRDHPVAGPDVARAVELLVAPLAEQLGKAEQRYEAERARAERAEQRADEAQAAERKAIELMKYATTEASELRRKADEAATAERIARDEAAGLRAERDARKQWGLWRRVRGR